jgi:hypothetical protein
MELEDALANRNAACWDFLATEITSNQECTLRERPSKVDEKGAGGPSLSMELSQDQIMVKKAIKQLLHGFGQNEHFSATNDKSLTFTVRNQLEKLFQRTIRKFETRSDFVNAHSHHQKLQEFQRFTGQTSGMTALREVLECIESTARASVERSLILETTCEQSARLLTPHSQLQRDHLEPLTESMIQLRDKMWYIAHVRTSAAYDEARSIASALRIMGKAKKSPSRTRMAPPLRHWTASKSSSTTFHLKSEAQVLELLSAKPEHCGPNKLSDDQSRLTAAWLKAQNVDILCRGEERLHKLCMEVRKCVESITNPVPENLMIHANTLFTRDVELVRAVATSTSSTSRKSGSLSSLYAGNGHSGISTLQTQLRSVEGLASGSKALSSTSSRDYLDARSPTLTTHSSIPFWSPVLTAVDSPSSATSVGSSHTQAAVESSLHKQSVGALTNPPLSAIERLRQRLAGLLLSDLTANLFTDGSETDNAFWTGLGWKLVQKHFCHIHDSDNTQRGQMTNNRAIHSANFDFETAFRRLLQKFAATSNPSTKLSCLYDIDRLSGPYMLKLNQSHTSLTPTHIDESTAAFRHLLTHPDLLPLLSTIFRDLQYIASLVPLQHYSSPQGTTFHKAALALSSLRTSARNLLVETADQIIAYHSNNRPGSSSIPHPPSPAQAQRDDAIFSPSPTHANGEQPAKLEDVSSYTLTDASHLLQIAAKDGCPVAQRELATLYLTHPEVITKVLAPFARAKEVFKEERNFQDKDKEKCDPAAMCVAIHWMGLSAEGGDGVAREVLRQGEEWVGLSG